MRQRFFRRYYILPLTFFGTENFSSRKIFKNYLHTYTKPLNTHYCRLLHHVCSLHKFGATNTKRGILMAFWRSLHVILLKLCLFRLTYPRRKKLFRMRKKIFHWGNNTFWRVVWCWSTCQGVQSGLGTEVIKVKIGEMAECFQKCRQPTSCNTQNVNA